jgi:hypothetical protein
MQCGRAQSSLPGSTWLDPAIGPLRKSSLIEDSGQSFDRFACVRNHPSVEQGVDVVLRRVADVALGLGPVQ